jgi:general secretion pathway protein D
MSGKQLIVLIALLCVAIGGSPLVAQEGSTPPQATPVPGQPAPVPNQPANPPSQGEPSPNQPSVPRQVPVPQAGTPGAPQQGVPQQAQPGTPSPGTPAPQEAAPPQRAPIPIPPERRSLPAPQISGGGGMVSLNFNQADLVEIVHIIAQHLRLTYTIDPQVKGTVTINSAEPLKSEDLLPIFHQILRMNGAVAVKAGNLYQIMPIKDGKGLVRPAGQNKEDSFALQIVPVRFFSVAEMKKVLTPFLQPGGEIVEYPRGNFLIITDLPSNIQRLMEIADLIDVQVFAGTRMEIYQPKVASAEELAQEMTKVMQSFAASAPQSDTFTAQFLPLPRINQLLVISHSEAAWTYAKRWLDRIDVIAEGPGRRIFIYPVENGKADDLANVLNQALGQPSTATRSSTQTLQDLHRFTTSSGTSQPGTSLGTRNPTGPTSFGPQGGMSSGLPYAQAAVAAPGQPPTPPSPAAPQQPGVPRPPTPGAQAARPDEQLRIVADPATNSLVIYGTAQEFQNVKNILKELDIVPRQVLLDVLVAEVTLSDTQSLGVEYEILRGNRSIFGQTFGSSGGLRTGILPQAGSDGFAQFGNGLSGIFSSGRNNAVKAFVNALATDSRLKVLSSPSILATDNRPARIQIGSEDPIATGTLSQAVGGVANSTSIQYRNTGRIVTVIPQVNSFGLVNLQLLAEVSQPGALVTVGSDQFPSFLTRQAETTAVVQDGDTLVIGGIITDNKNRSRTGIPYLMDLPVIGRLFGSTNDTTDRTELIMLITPHVIRSREQGQQVTEDFKKSLSTVRNELERMAKERAKLQQQPLQDRPTLPGPSSDQPPNPPPPAPAPTAAPAGSGPAISPVKKINSRTEVYPSAMQLGSLRPEEESQTINAAPIESALSVATANPQVPAAAQAQPPPAYALTITSPPNSTTAAPPMPKPMSRRTEPKTTYLWTVQVAATIRRQDAEVVAGLLRDKGYDAYVMAAEVNGSLWHRIRVGQSLTRPDASKLQKTLQVSEKFASAYIISR